MPDRSSSEKESAAGSQRSDPTHDHATGGGSAGTGSPATPSTGGGSAAKPTWQKLGTALGKELEER